MNQHEHMHTYIAHIHKKNAYTLHAYVCTYVHLHIKKHHTHMCMYMCVHVPYTIHTHVYLYPGSAKDQREKCQHISEGSTGH